MIHGNAYLLVCADGTVSEATYMGMLNTKAGVVFRFMPLPFRDATWNRAWIRHAELQDFYDLGKPRNSIEFDVALNKVLGVTNA